MFLSKCTVLVCVDNSTHMCGLLNKENGKEGRIKVEFKHFSLQCGCRDFCNVIGESLTKVPNESSPAYLRYGLIIISAVLNYLLAESSQQKECPLNITSTVMDFKVLIPETQVTWTPYIRSKKNFHAIMPDNINFLIYLYVNLAIIFKFVMLVLFHIAILYLGIAPIKIFM